MHTNRSVLDAPVGGPLDARVDAGEDIVGQPVGWVNEVLGEVGHVLERIPSAVLDTLCLDDARPFSALSRHGLDP